MAKIQYTRSELDKTRKNMGAISKEEAARMVKVLGGEIGEEIDDQYPAKNSAPILRENADAKQANSKDANESGETKSTSAAEKTKQPVLPQIDKSTMRFFLRLYFHPNHKIINFSSYFFGVLFGTSAEKLSPAFLQKSVGNNLNLCEKFVNSAREIISMIPNGANDLQAKRELVFAQFLTTVSKWDFNEAAEKYDELKTLGANATVADSVTLIRAIYKNLIAVIFVNDALLSEICIQLEDELKKKAGLPHVTTRKIITNLKRDWSRIQNQVIRGLYPILMRALIKDCLPINTFFSTYITKILGFLNVNRFSLVLAKHEKPENAAVAKNVDSTKEIDESIAERVAQRKAARDEVLFKQLGFADLMFPNAGWFELDSCPDFFAYFQPIFEFPDGFNEIAPDNPMQVVAALLKILDDLTAVIHHVEFKAYPNCGFDAEKIKNELQNGYFYLNENFGHDYVPMLCDYVNNLYSSHEFENSPNAKRALAKIYWYQKTLFFPYYKFELSYLPNETYAEKRKPLFRTVASLSRIFSEFSTNIDAALDMSNGKFEGEVLGIANPWELYSFAMPNPSSRRLNAVLGGKNSIKKNNANLIKAVSAYLFILNWYLSDNDSPAYQSSGKYPFRRNASNAPEFEVNLRADINDLFVSNLKQKIAIATGEKNEQG